MPNHAYRQSETWWAVQVDGTPTDITSAAAATGPIKTTLEKSDRGDWLLTSERFNGLSANEVRYEAAAILAALVGAAKLSNGHVRPLRVGHLSRIHADGRRDTQVLAGGVFVPTQVFPAGVVRSQRSDGVLLASPPSLQEMAMIACDADPGLRGALEIFARGDDALVRAALRGTRPGVLSTGIVCSERLSPPAARFGAALLA